MVEKPVKRKGGHPNFSPVGSGWIEMFRLFPLITNN